MVDRQKIETILARRFPGSTTQVVATAANAIMGLYDEWQEIVDHEHYLGCHSATPCREACYLAKELEHSSEFRLFRRARDLRD